MLCLCWWYITEILVAHVNFGRRFGLTWDPNASLIPAIIHKQMVKLRTTIIVLNKYCRVLSYRLAMSGYGLSILASVSLH